MTPETGFELGCLTKFLTSAVALILASRAIIDLDAPLSVYLPELAGGNGDRIAMRHLLSHTAGYQGDDLLDVKVLTQSSWSNFANSFGGRAMLFDAGRVYDYSQSAFSIVGEIIYRATGQHVSELLHQIILHPLGLDHETPTSAPVAPCALGHVHSPTSGSFTPIVGVRMSGFWKDSLLGAPLTPTQLARLAGALVSGEAPFDSQILSWFTQKMVSIPRLFGGVRREDSPIAAGMGWSQFSPRAYGLSSSMPGQSLALRVDPYNETIVVVAINCFDPFLRDFIANRLMNVFSPSEVPRRSDERIPDVFEFRELTGYFEGPLHSSFDASVVDRQLVLLHRFNPALTQSTLRASLVLSQSAAGYLVPSTDMHHLSMGFFRAQPCGTPCFMIGGTVFKKLREATYEPSVQQES